MLHQTATPGSAPAPLRSEEAFTEVIACFWFWIGDSAGGWIEMHHLLDEQWEYQQLGMHGMDELGFGQGLTKVLFLH